jgi:Omp85 superfamily domain
MKSSAAPERWWILCAAMAVCAIAASAGAQERRPAAPNRVVADYLYEPEGYIFEPDLITRAAIFADRHFGKGDLTNGIYVDMGDQMIPGAGWITVGPGYRKWYSKDQLFLDASAAMSWNGYKSAGLRVEAPKLMRSRLLLGAEGTLQDFTQIMFFGEGPVAPHANESAYRLRSKEVVGYATVRPVEWIDVTASGGWFAPSILEPSEGFLFGKNRANALDLFAGNPSFSNDAPTFLRTELSVVADRRDYPGHPTSGSLVRGLVTGYADRDSNVFNFRRYEAEVEHFVPLDRARVVLAVRGWVAASQTDAGQIVPIYLEPSLGGTNSLRGYQDYRFHDRNLALLNIETRVAIFTHMDGAVFVDAGNVAARFGDLNLDHRDYGFGIRFHTRRETFARVDVARGADGWRLAFRMSEPLNPSRYSRRTVAAPFVP